MKSSSAISTGGVLKALHAEALQITAEVIKLEAVRADADARRAAIGRYDDVRATLQTNLDAERRAVRKRRMSLTPPLARRRNQPHQSMTATPTMRRGRQSLPMRRSMPMPNAAH